MPSIPPASGVGRIGSANQARRVELKMSKGVPVAERSRRANKKKDERLLEPLPEDAVADADVVAEVLLGDLEEEVAVDARRPELLHVRGEV